MSVRLMARVFDESKTRGADRLTLLVLADACNDEGESAWPALATIARKAGVGKGAARVSLECLRRVGVADWVPRYKKTGGQTSNAYRLIPAMIGKDSIGKELRAEIRATIKGSRKADAIPPGGQALPRTPRGYPPHTPRGATTHPLTLKTPPPPVDDKQKARAAVRDAYEKNIGVVVPMISDYIDKALESVSPEVVIHAIGEAVSHNAPAWTYIEAVIDRVRREGFQSPQQKRAARTPAPIVRRGERSSRGQGPTLADVFKPAEINALYGARMNQAQAAVIISQRMTYEAALSFVQGSKNGTD